MKRIIILVCSLLLAGIGTASGAQQIGSVVALKGKATIARGTARVEALVKSGIELKDTVKTAPSSRAKLLFIDESVLTLGDDSTMQISEFIHSRTDRGKSLFNLLDGKMRAVVGKTKVEVKTPTAVAAARGTVIYFEVGMLDGKHYTKIISLEGTVEVRGLVPGDTGVMELTPGMMVIIMEGERVGVPVLAPAAEIERARRETTLSGSEISLPTPKLPDTVSAGVFQVSVPTIVPLFEQQVPPVTVAPHQPTTVNINVNF